ncbi:MULTISPECIES: site-specific integrase [unclassified Kitasatospora]|uniref:site-specific integrase n=1 Tax=unclassified Kitasatospora TaxID=2633591 RepID=UPI000709054D|nr:MULTISPECIES: site-specific integrase [unclassified Kitasatospora]
MEWSSRYDHLREVTRDDVLAHLETVHGSQRRSMLIALRSLFGRAKKSGTIFEDPTSRIRVGQQELGIVQPLASEQVQSSVSAATRPDDRLILALAAVHAARTGAICRLQLDDLDIGNRRLTVDGRVCPLDALTLRLALAWLEYRARRWPDTANPHLLVNKQTALAAGPISGNSAAAALRGQAATLEKLRVDRQLEEALIHGPDPLHLAEVFGLDEKTAIRYANSARQLLEQPAETATVASPRTHGPTPAEHTDRPSGSR